MQPSITDIKVYGYLLDIFGHVNNARYLEFMEAGRWNFVEGKIDLIEWKRRGIAFTVVNININYRRPAVLGDILEIHTKMSDIVEKSATIRQEIFIKGTDTLIVDADVTFVMVDIRKKKAIIFPDNLRDFFLSMIE